MLLDGSGSMSGKKFKSLEKAVEEFVTFRKKVCDDKELISIGVFDDTFSLVAKQEKMQSFKKSICFPGGGTDFYVGIEGLMRIIKLTSDD